MGWSGRADFCQAAARGGWQVVGPLGGGGSLVMLGKSYVTGGRDEILSEFVLCGIPVKRRENRERAVEMQ